MGEGRVPKGTVEVVRGGEKEEGLVLLLKLLLKLLLMFRLLLMLR